MPLDLVLPILSRAARKLIFSKSNFFTGDSIINPFASTNMFGRSAAESLASPVRTISEMPK